VCIIKGYKVVKVACGGAHSLVLAEKTTQPSIANKWGSHRQVFAFGSVPKNKKQTLQNFQSSICLFVSMNVLALFVSMYVCVCVCFF
jgi:alpha-tubulin suppressor-like RCC1 family protein